jgi:hypothetical protein
MHSTGKPGTFVVPGFIFGREFYDRITPAHRPFFCSDSRWRTPAFARFFLCFAKFPLVSGASGNVINT